ncbi:MAG: hypothetical protein Q8Q47_04375, partial [Ignavibacteriaceae bacterium]|nr:hypothetical protein [Ignavibacteriaceae bacterium]
MNNPSVSDISNGNFTMTSSCLPVNIISHPQNKTVSAGTTTTFNTSVNGTGPFLYYWFKNNVQIPNANSSSYSTGIVTPEDNGSIYKCIVVNCNGVYQAISNSAVLTVTGVNCTPVVIIMEPQSKTVPLGSTANFTVSVNGTPPFVLTWFKNNIQIPGANSLSYTTDILTTFDDGNTYKCIIKNCNNTNQIISNNAVLTVSNSNTSLTFFHHIPEIPHFANRYLLYSSITSNSLPKICSDGSASTIIRYINVGYNEMNYLKFKIKENTSGNDGENFGSFGTIQKYTDSIIVRYTHPQVVATDSMKRTITLQIINSNTNQIIKEQLIEIYRTPVLMVHGLWSNDGEFTEMENRLKLKYYPDEILRRANYQITNDASFSENKNVIPLEINYLIQKAINADYSSGKVDIIAHSMGGILARYYIQNKSQFNFKNNINRLVTLNTPHSGSQGANLLLKEGTPYAMIRNLLFHKFKRCVECGAVNDLRVNSEEIDLLRIGEGQSNIIPKRAIVSNTLPGLP